MAVSSAKICRIIFQIICTQAILSNGTRKLLWFEISTMLIAVLRNKFIVSFSISFGTLSFPVNSAQRLARGMRIVATRGTMETCEASQCRRGDLQVRSYEWQRASWLSAENNTTQRRVVSVRNLQAIAQLLPRARNASQMCACARAFYCKKPAENSIDYCWRLAPADPPSCTGQPERARTRVKSFFSVLIGFRETRDVRGERDNARKNATCMQARKTTHDLGGQRRDVDRTQSVEESEWQRTGTNGESASMVWPTLRSRTA